MPNNPFAPGWTPQQDNQYAPSTGGGSTDLPEDLMSRLLPTDGSDSMLLVRDTSASDAVARWEAPPALSKYRGTWEPDALVALYDFGTGTLTPFVDHNPAGTALAADGAVVGMVTTPGANKPAVAQATKATVRSSAGGAIRGLQVTPSEVPLLAAQPLTRVKYFHSEQNTTSPNSVFEVAEAGVAKRSVAFPANGTASAWVEDTVALSNTGVISFRIRNTNTATASNAFYLASIRFYGTADPYDFGDTVDFGGSLYRSEINNNSEQPNPSADGAWTKVVVL